jgi:putative endonuclease
LTRERLDLGRIGEELALKKIKGLGYKKVAQNYRCPLGEVDLIARDGDALVFIEIKTRRGPTMDRAKEAVDGRKRRKLSQLALAYLKSHGLQEVRARFDVVTVCLDQGRPQVEVIRNAFDLVP